MTSGITGASENFSTGVSGLVKIPLDCAVDSTILLLSKSEISSLKPSSVAVQAGLCRAWSEMPKTGFHMRQRSIAMVFCFSVCHT